MFAGRIRMMGDAFPGININPTNDGERAQASISFLQRFVTTPYEVGRDVWDILLGAATGYQWVEIGKKSAPLIKQELDRRPEMKNALDQAYSYAKSVGEYVADTSAPYVWLLKNGPYVLGGLVLLGVYFAFTNPDSVRPEKVSLF